MTRTSGRIALGVVCAAVGFVLVGTSAAANTTSGWAVGNSAWFLWDSSWDFGGGRERVLVSDQVADGKSAVVELTANGTRRYCWDPGARGGGHACLYQFGEGQRLSLRVCIGNRRTDSHTSPPAGALIGCVARTDIWT